MIIVGLDNKVNLTLDVYLDGALFNSISKDSYQLLAHGREADMVRMCLAVLVMCLYVCMYVFMYVCVHKFVSLCGNVCRSLEWEV